MERRLPAWRFWRPRPLPSGARPSLRARDRARALPVPAGDLHGDFRLPGVRRRALGPRLDRRRHRSGQRPLPFRPRTGPAMSDTLSVPLWLALPAALLAAWALYEHVVVPALRWVVTHPANQMIDELSTRLRISIRPFQRTRRQA